MTRLESVLVLHLDSMVRVDVVRSLFLEAESQFQRVSQRFPFSTTDSL